MAVIYSRTCGETNYQLRSAGYAKRLYTNGVFHSQWNPKRPLAGAVWDLLSLPVLYLPLAETRTLRILLLGVGGGAVLRQLQLLCPQSLLVGVELDPVHLQLAENYFGVDAQCAELVCADAVSWVREYSGEKFDCVIDDLFSHSNGEPERAVAMNARWLRSLRRITARDGLLIANFASSAELRSSALAGVSRARVYQWAQPGYENAIGACVLGAGDAYSWRAAIKQHEALNAESRRTALACQRRKIA